ncbi:MAG: hypothetical protein H6Q48_3415, partial [Deltaproteobacteria bacterium]|nr:hypothetical protein [Deltaproteobacteria bacterium]
ITNQYVWEGVNGGLITLLLFLLMIGLCFRAVGLTLQKAENHPFEVRILIWSLGASLVSHLMSFFSVSYFDQVVMFWYFLLASISSASESIENKPRKPEAVGIEFVTP